MTAPTQPSRLFVHIETLTDFAEAAALHDVPEHAYRRFAGANSQVQARPGARYALPKLLNEGIPVFVFALLPPRHNLHAVAEQITWLNQYFDGFGERLIVARDLSLLGNTRDRLIDSFMPFETSTTRFPGEIVLFNGNWRSMTEELLRQLTAPLA